MTARVFLREATGLVRSLSPLDVFILGVVGITPGVNMTLFYLYIAFLYPGANVPLAVIGAIPMSLIFGAVYWLMSISMPRTGGDYVYGSRIIHPLWGFLPSWMYAYVNVSALGFYSATIGGSFLAVFFAMLGNFYNNATLLAWASVASSVSGALVIALVAIWVSALINVLGMGAYVKAQLVMFIIAMAGIVVLLALLGVNSNQTFQSAFNQYASAYGTSYQGIINQAKSSGWAPQGFDLPQTILALPFILLTLATVWPAIPAGEARRPQRSMLYGSVVAIAISSVVLWATAVLFYNVVGEEFSKAISYVGNCGCTTNPLPVGPYIQYLSGILAGNPAVIFFLGFSFFVWSLILLPAFYVITTRPIFAWSFDRLIPSFMADINDRYHAPMKAILLVAILSSVMAALALYTTIVGLAFNITLACVSSFIFVGVAAAVFPYRKKARQIYERSPSVVKRKVLGIPVITILGVLEAVSFAYVTFLAATSPALSGPINAISVGLIIVMYIVGIAIYFASKGYHKRYGLDIDLAFQEVPPE
jgi:APA family basic amino acid/polyamine antiporter